MNRSNKADAEADLDELLAVRAAGLDGAEALAPRRQRLASFAEVIDEWVADGCPSVAPNSRTRHSKVKSPDTVANARMLLDVHVRPAVGSLWVERTRTERLEELFAAVAAAGYATSTIDCTWGYLNQACQYAQRRRRINTNPAQDVLLPEVRPAKSRKPLTVEQASRLLVEAIPSTRILPCG